MQRARRGFPKNPCARGDAAEIKVRATRKIGVADQDREGDGQAGEGKRCGPKNASFQKTHCLSRSVVWIRTLHTGRSLEAMREGKFAKRLDEIMYRIDRLEGSPPRGSVGLRAV